MKISPLDIKKQEFGKKFRGYSPDEVYSFLNLVAGEMERLLKKNLELEEKIKSLEEKLSNYMRIENILQDTLLTTQKSAEETKSSAEMKAKALLDEAHVNADKIMSGAREELLKIQKEIEELKIQKDSFIVSFKSLIDTQKSLLEMVENRNEERRGALKIRMKRDLSDEDLERVVDDFERQYDSRKSETDNMESGFNRLEGRD